MNNKEYKNFVYELSTIITPYNQLLYQILILIILYFFFNNITNVQIQCNNNNVYLRHKFFIILYISLVIIIDWYIWNNIIQTSLFISILILYVYYNLQHINLISLFINISGDLNNNTNMHNLNTIHKKNNENAEYNAYNIPLNISASALTTVKNANKYITPQPYDILNKNKNNNNNKNNEIKDAYKLNSHNTYITDPKYAEILYQQLF